MNKTIGKVFKKPESYIRFKLGANRNDTVFYSIIKNNEKEEGKIPQWGIEDIIKEHLNKLANQKVQAIRIEEKKFKEDGTQENCYAFSFKDDKAKTNMLITVPSFRIDRSTEQDDLIKCLKKLKAAITTGIVLVGVLGSPYLNNFLNTDEAPEFTPPAGAAHVLQETYGDIDQENYEIDGTKISFEQEGRQR